MGMYDYVKCEYPLPDGTIRANAEFQTKDFDCMMDVVTITAEGRLMLRESHYATVPEEERPYFGKPEWEEPLYQLAGSIRLVVDREYDANFHGEFEFRDGVTNYIARFTDGQLDHIRIDTFD